MTDRPIIVVPGDDPALIQGSPHLEQLEPYRAMQTHTDGSRRRAEQA